MSVWCVSLFGSNIFSGDEISLHYSIVIQTLFLQHNLFTTFTSSVRDPSRLLHPSEYSKRDMPVLIILTAKSMVEMIRKREYQRLTCRVVLVAAIIGMCFLFTRGRTTTNSAISSQNTVVPWKGRLRGVGTVPSRMSFMATAGRWGANRVDFSPIRKAMHPAVVVVDDTNLGRIEESDTEIDIER